MPRTKGSPNKFNAAKEAANITKQVESLIDSAMTPEINLGLIKAGFGLGVHTLIQASMGDEGIKGLSATNRITAAKELKDLGLKVLGDDAFKALESAAEKESQDKADAEEGEEQSIYKIADYKKV